jgi:hypothetical protein
MTVDFFTTADPADLMDATHVRTPKGTWEITRYDYDDDGEIVKDKTEYCTTCKLPRVIRALKPREKDPRYKEWRVCFHDLHMECAV